MLPMQTAKICKEKWARLKIPNKRQCQTQKQSKK